MHATPATQAVAGIEGVEDGEHAAAGGGGHEREGGRRRTDEPLRKRRERDALDGPAKGTPPGAAPRATSATSPMS